jgi:hypothetical protein
MVCRPILQAGKSHYLRSLNINLLDFETGSTYLSDAVEKMDFSICIEWLFLVPLPIKKNENYGIPMGREMADSSDTGLDA